MERRLVTILAADVVGYSRLVEEDEEGTLRTLGACRGIIDELVTQHSGRVFGSAGDSVVVEFASPVDAVRCAACIQRDLERRNADLPEDHRMRFRIGINLGDVIVEGDNLLGDGVNIAARLEALADAGGICLSQPVFDQIKKKLDLGYEDIGEQEVKNIAEPIRVYRVLTQPEAIGKVIGQTKPAPPAWKRMAVAAAVIALVGVAGVSTWLKPWEPKVDTASVERMALPMPEKPSIAVLPFDNLSGDPEQAYFADGMTDDLITDLSKISGLFVIARNTSFTFKGKKVAVPKVAEKLGVRYVLKGSVRRAGNQVRVNAQLIDATTGGHLWAERYDGDVTNYFKAQDTFVLKIVSALSLKLSRGEQEEIAKGQTASAEARAAYQRGWDLYQQYTANSNAQATDHFKRAVEIDPNYGRAYSALSMAYVRGCQWRWHKELKMSTGKAFDEATRFLKKAERNSSSMTRVASSQINLYDAEHDVAFTEAASAVALDPNDPEAQVAMGLAMITTGRPKAGLEFVKTAVRLNPTYPTYYSLALALGYFSMNEMEQVVGTLEATMKRNSTAVDLAPLLAAGYAHLGRRKEARTALQLWKPGASDSELQIASALYHFPYTLEGGQRNVEQRLRHGLAVAAMPEDITVASLKNKLRRGETSERVLAIKTLARFGTLAVDAVPDLILVLQDENKSLRERAVTTLGRIGPPAKAAIPALEAMRDNGTTTFPIERALKRIREP